MNQARVAADDISQPWLTSDFHQSCTHHLLALQELEALKGWRQLLSLGLEALDFATPLLKRAGQRMGEALSWLLVGFLGRALGLIFKGIRQSLVPNWGQKSKSGQQEFRERMA